MKRTLLTLSLAGVAACSPQNPPQAVPASNSTVATTEAAPTVAGESLVLPPSGFAGFEITESSSPDSTRYQRGEVLVDVVVKKGPPNKPIPRKKFTENFLETQRRLGKVRVKERGPVTITELDSDTCEAAVVTAHWVDGADEEGRDRSS